MLNPYRRMACRERKGFPCFFAGQRIPKLQLQLDPASGQKKGGAYLQAQRQGFPLVSGIYSRMQLRTNPQHGGQGTEQGKQGQDQGEHEHIKGEISDKTDVK